MGLGFLVRVLGKGSWSNLLAARGDLRVELKQPDDDEHLQLALVRQRGEGVPRV